VVVHADWNDALRRRAIISQGKYMKEVERGKEKFSPEPSGGASPADTD
jgi:hypothetical protein